MISKKRIQYKVENLLIKCSITEPPIDVVKIAETLGIEIHTLQFDDPNVSGILIKKANDFYIGLNELQPKNRQRFSIAHELGHYTLHILSKSIFVDDFEKFRDKVSSEGSKEEEIEANAFAAELLMPEQFIRKDLEEIDICDEECVRKLAQKYQVSTESFVYRVSNLGMKLDLFG
jgi:Zn-dependent peptidase ImmA (M78 family)